MLFTVAEFLKWAEKQDEEEDYRFDDVYGCPIYQFLRDSGHKDYLTVLRDYFILGEKCYIIPPILIKVLDDYPNTYGSMVNRLNKYLLKGR